MTRQEIIEQAKIMIAWLEANPDLPIMYIAANGGTVSQEIFKTAVRCPGPWKKDYSDSFASIVRTFGPPEYEIFFPVDYKVDTPRASVCRRVVKGTKIVPATEEIVIPACPEHEEEIVEWECDPILSPEEEEQIISEA